MNDSIMADIPDMSVIRADISFTIEERYEENGRHEAARGFVF